MNIALTLSLAWFAPALLATGQENAKTPPPKRAHHALVYDGSTRTIVMCGGSTPLDGGDSSRFFDDVWCLDAGGWSLVGNSGDERSGIALAYDSRRKKVYSLGGCTGSGKRVADDGPWTHSAAVERTTTVPAEREEIDMQRHATTAPPGARLRSPRRP